MADVTLSASFFTSVFADIIRKHKISSAVKTDIHRFLHFLFLLASDVAIIRSARARTDSFISGPAADRPNLLIA